MRHGVIRTRRRLYADENSVPIDKCWARACEPQLKRQSVEWQNKCLPQRQKFWRNTSLVKLMVIVS